ncbi:MAG: N-acetyl-gamma-glutamyl-phosphate reductase [Phycisphaerae bacterium]|nr:N-acetyl-gamma-glutamyl-phosphate reductase [Phycisphaerae bacterium]
MAQEQNTKKIKTILVGGTGYTGAEVIRIAARHPNIELVGIYGPEDELGPMEKFFPALTDLTDLSQELFAPDKIAGTGAELALLAVPHKVAMSYVPILREASLRVIDFSADYRLKDVAVYEKWYCKHTDAARVGEAVYGLPEYFAAQIARADLVANPGCYPTCAALPLAPAIKAGLIEPDRIVVNAISGVSGAGRKPAPQHHFPQRNENFEPYGVGTHRHTPEIEQVLTELTGRDVTLLFQPHVCPMDRGMLCSIYATPTGQVTPEQITDLLTDAYEDAPFVRVRTDVLPATKYVANTNFCDIAARTAKGRVVFFSALDNLIKGAAGQAIQNANIMFGLDQTTGLY